MLSGGVSDVRISVYNVDLSTRTRSCYFLAHRTCGARATELDRSLKYRALDWSRCGVRNGTTSHPVQVCAGFQAFPLLVWVCVVPRKRLVRSVKRLVSIDTAFPRRSAGPHAKSAIFTFCCE